MATLLLILLSNSWRKDSSLLFSITFVILGKILSSLLFFLMTSPKAYEATRKLAGVDEEQMYLMEVRNFVCRRNFTRRRIWMTRPLSKPFLRSADLLTPSFTLELWSLLANLGKCLFATTRTIWLVPSIFSKWCATTTARRSVCLPHSTLIFSFLLLRYCLRCWSRSHHRGISCRYWYCQSLRSYQVHDGASVDWLGHLR